MWTWLIGGGFVLFLLACLIVALFGDYIDDDGIFPNILLASIILGLSIMSIGLVGAIFSSAGESDDRLIKEKAEIIEQLETVKSKELLDVVVKEAYDWNKDHNDNEELIIDIDNILLDREDKK